MIGGTTQHNSRRKSRESVTRSPAGRPSPNPVCQTSGDISSVSPSSPVVSVGTGSSTSSGVTSTNTADTLTAPRFCPSDCCVDRLPAGQTAYRSTSPRIGGNKHVPHNHPRGHKYPPGVQLSQPGRRWVVHHHHQRYGVEIHYWSGRLTPLSGTVAIFRPETFRCDPGWDHHVTDAHILWCLPGQQIWECLFHFRAPTHPVTRFATGSPPGHTRCSRKQVLQQGFHSRHPSLRRRCRRRGRYFRTVVVSVKSLTPWASVGVAVSAPVRLEAGYRATPQDRSVLPVER